MSQYCVSPLASRSAQVCLEWNWDKGRKQIDLFRLITT